MPVNYGKYVSKSAHEFLVANDIRQVAFGESNFFDATYFPEDADGNKVVTPGLVMAYAAVAVDGEGTATYKYVPYEPGGTYGVLSDTPDSLLADRLDVTKAEETTAGLYHGKVKEAKVYVLGQTWDDVKADVKAALADVRWV